MHQALAHADIPDRCELQHKLFSSPGGVRFRRASTDGVTMMALQLGEREAMLPIDALRREFAIGKDSADGRMLDLIGSALDFVSSVQPGDRLPPEVRTGEASWRPSPHHLCFASTRLRLNLVSWMLPASHWAEAKQDAATLLRLSADPALYADVRAVSATIARQLGLADGDDVIRVVEELSQELAYIEALRERLQARVVALCKRLGRLQRDANRRLVPFDTLSYVHRLATLAAKQIISRFDDIEAQTGEIGSLLRNIENQRNFIRSNRDWLYCTQRAWEPVLDQWDHGVELPPEELGTLLAVTYRFLAQRSLPGTVWQRPRQQRRRPVPASGQMTW